MFTELKRVTYLVDDVPKAKEWYASLLGHPPVFDTPFAVIFRIGEQSLSLSKATDGGVGSGRVEVFWEVDDIDAVHAALIARGATAVSPITDVLNVRVARVRDPFGNVIGLNAPALADAARTVDRAPSATAMVTAFCRALAARNKRGPDALAEVFLSEEWKKALVDEASRSFAVNTLMTPSLYGFIIARTAYIDALVADAGSYAQVVLVGAGYDTRFHRFTDTLRHARVFELDIATTQRNKTESLERAGIATPSSLVYVPVDFKRQTVAEALDGAGYDASQRTLFVWEGVTYYLPEPVVDATLESVSARSGLGSRIVLDYMTQRHKMMTSSEPFVFWIEPDAMAKKLAAAGMRVIEDLCAEELKGRYLTGDELIFPHIRIAVAEVLRHT
jgi:methyltransferase (TIGR00027 family)